MSEPVVIATIDKSRSKSVRVSLATWREDRRVDLRVFVPLAGPAAVPMATKEGFALGIDKLDDLTAALQDARAKAVEMGWLQPRGPR